MPNTTPTPIPLPPPGSERDALVARHVMGWSYGAMETVDRGVKFWFVGSERAEYADRIVRELPCWSTRDGAVLKVVEAMRERGYFWTAGASAVGTHWCRIAHGRHKQGVVVHAPTLSDAITAAALRALGVCE